MTFYEIAFYMPTLNNRGFFIDFLRFELKFLYWGRLEKGNKHYKRKKNEAF